MHGFNFRKVIAEAEQHGQMKLAARWPWGARKWHKSGVLRTTLRRGQREAALPEVTGAYPKRKGRACVQGREQRRG